uniref:U-box domain-containing protein n=1 Tax=Panagrolaimus sp. PS1159 TaxID=55785 RepID=A0AC35GNI7_9BILA
MTYKIGPIVLRNIDFLKKLASTRSCQQRNKIIENASRDNLLSLVDVCFNVLEANIPLTRQRKTALTKHAQLLRALAECRSPKKARETLLKGGGEEEIPDAQPITLDRTQESTPKSVAKTPRRPRTNRTNPKKSPKQNNNQIVDQIVQHVMQNKNIYPVTSNEQIVDRNNEVIPLSNIRQSVKRYLDAKPGEHTPPGTNKLTSILKADPDVIPLKRAFKPDNWKKL